MASVPLGILLMSGSYDRIHYAFVLAAGAAAIGRPVVLFATNAGCAALLDDISDLAGSDDDHVVRERGVAGLDELRTASRDLGVRMIACESGMRIADIAPERLLADVEVAGVVTFLAATAAGQTIAL